jgi:hypothetical protein
LNSQALEAITRQVATTEARLDRVEFCFNVYLHHAHHGGEPTADMDMHKALLQLTESLVALFGYDS